MHLGLVTIVVKDYDAAIGFFVSALGFELAEDSPASTNDGRPKRWVVVRPPGAATGAAYRRMAGAGVEFLTSPRSEPYGRVAVFRDIAGNKWDLLSPA